MYLSYDNYKETFENNKKKYNELDRDKKYKFIEGIFKYYNRSVPLLEYIKSDIDFSFNNLLKEQNYSVSTNCNKMGIFKKYELNSLINFIDSKKNIEYKNMKNDFLDCHITINDEDYIKNYVEINNLSNYYQNKQRLECIVNKYEKTNNYYKKNYKQILDKYFNGKYENGLIINELNFKNNDEEYKKSLNHILLQELIHRYNKACTIYKPYLFKLFINIFKPINRNVNIIDLSSGWGDRILGVLSIEDKVDKYIGIDPNKNLMNGYNKMINDFSKNKNKYQLIQSPAEDVNYSTLPKNIDIIFWSPPFSIQEDYVSDKTRDDYKDQSTNKYKSYEDWEDNFLINVINLSTNNLRRNGVFILYIGSINYKSFFSKMRNIQKLRYLGNIHLKANNIKDYIIFVKTDEPNKCKFIENNYEDSRVIEIKNKLKDNEENPKLNIIKINVNNKKINVIQDNVLIVGTKQRMVIDLIRELMNNDTEYLVYASSYMGYGAVATAYGAYKLGLKCMVFLDRTKMGKIIPENENTILNSRQVLTLMALNAKIYLCDNYRNARNLEYDYSTIITETKNVWKTRENFLIPSMGFNDKEKKMVNILSEKIVEASKGTIIESIKNIRIWLVAGSGGIIEAIKKSYPEAEIFVYLTGGGKYYDNVVRWIKTQNNITILNNNKNYNIENIKNDYYKYYESVENYDSMIFPYVKEYGKDNDFIWNVSSD